MSSLIIQNLSNCLPTPITNIGLKTFVDSTNYLFENTTPLRPICSETRAVQGLWGVTKEYFKSIEPYQPIAATLTILSKAVWRSCTRSKIKHSIKKQERSLAVIKGIQETKKIDLSKQIGQVSSDLRQKRIEETHSVLAFLQLGSLLFPHPGSNVWNSVNNLVGRFASFGNISPTSSPLNTALGLVSIGGITTSLLKQMGTITGDAPLCHLILGASFIGMGIETVIMIKNWVHYIQNRTTREAPEIEPEEGQTSEMDLSPGRSASCA